ncbi:MAG: hypothetical protein K0Q66_483 [Chitinophagaceae bacterium]|jgi:hypothetical protein|nr:hypothetical protein [Chitinophagaceae bacterium]
MPNFTPEELIQYLYGESSHQQAQAIESALQNDWILQQKFRVLRESQQQLDAVPLEKPRKQAVSAILRYARETAEVAQ